MILLAAGILCLIVFVTTGFLLLDYWYESKQQEKLNQQLAELKHGTTSDAVYVKAEPLTTPTREPDSSQTQATEEAQQDTIAATQPTEVQDDSETQQSLSDINPDYVMWLQIADTEIDYPVVQRDNSYYLKHDFYGEQNKHGTIFIDERCDAEGSFLLLHGHHMKDGTMFGSLKNYKKADFREQHRSLSLDWETEQEEYEIFAGALIDLLQTERFYYEELPESEEEIEAYLQQLKATAFWYEEPQWGEEERFVILSTCDYGTKEQRLILVAVQKN